MLVAALGTHITIDWFDPDFWGRKANLVDAGGRGTAWFVDSPDGAMVLRQYRRGGFISKLSDRSYLYTGDARARSFAEFRLLTKLARLGLPVPEAIAALIQRKGLLTYRAALIVRRIPGAVPLPEAELVNEPDLWNQVGVMVRRFHDAGLDHVDLNCDNILVAGSSLFLIDFDKCRLHSGQQKDAPWKARNLARLQRSVRKRCAHLTVGNTKALWSAFIAGYND